MIVEAWSLLILKQLYILNLNLGPASNHSLDEYVGNVKSTELGNNKPKSEIEKRVTLSNFIDRLSNTMVVRGQKTFLERCKDLQTLEHVWRSGKEIEKTFFFIPLLKAVLGVVMQFTIFGREDVRDGGAVATGNENCEDFVDVQDYCTFCNHINLSGATDISTVSQERLTGP